MADCVIKQTPHEKSLRYDLSKKNISTEKANIKEMYVSYTFQVRYDFLAQCFVSVVLLTLSVLSIFKADHVISS